MTEDNNASSTFGKYTGDDVERPTREETSIWLGAQLAIPDNKASLDPEEIESNVREWTLTLLKDDLIDKDSIVDREGTPITPREESWDKNPLFVRYREEQWSNEPDEDTDRKRIFDIWFPIGTFLEHRKLNDIRRAIDYLMGRHIGENYDRGSGIGDIIVSGSEKQVRHRIRQSFDDVEFEDYL